MRAPSIAFYVALFLLLHFFRIKFLSLLAFVLACGVAILWRYLRLNKLHLNPPSQAAAFVTGATSGIGLETALQFARSGLVTFAGCRDLSDAEELIRAAGPVANMIVPIECDVTRNSSVQQAANIVREEMEKRNLLGLYACTLVAGIMSCVPTEIIDDLEQRECFETNYFGTVRCIQAFVPMLRYYSEHAKERSHLNIISSVLGIMSGPGLAPYSCTKFALEAMADSLRPELSMWNIHVSTYEFAAIDSRVADRFQKEVYDVNSIYYTFRNNFRKVLFASRMAPASPVAAAWHILANIYCRFPASRVTFGKPMELLTDFVLLMLPDRVRDFVMMKTLGM